MLQQQQQQQEASGADDSDEYEIESQYIVVDFGLKKGSQRVNFDATRHVVVIDVESEQPRLVVNGKVSSDIIILFPVFLLLHSSMDGGQFTSNLFCQVDAISCDAIS